MENLHDKTRDKRLFPRFSYKQPVKFYLGEYCCPEGSLSRDLSRGGICLTVHEFVAVKSPIIVHLQWHKETRVFEVKGMVTWMKAFTDSERYQIGVQFDSLGETVKDEVDRIIKQLQ